MRLSLETSNKFEPMLSHCKSDGWPFGIELKLIACLNLSQYNRQWFISNSLHFSQIYVLFLTISEKQFAPSSSTSRILSLCQKAEAKDITTQCSNHIWKTRKPYPHTQSSIAGLQFISWKFELNSKRSLYPVFTIAPLQMWYGNLFEGRTQRVL